MDLLNYVNIKQGTKSVSRFSNGNALPLVQRPFGFASFAPQTDSTRGVWFYHPEDRSFEGIRLTHQPSPWIRDHGAITILPQTENPHMKISKRWTSINPEKTVLMPHYMKYYLNRQRATIELTPTEYGACIKVAFDNNYENYLSILPVEGLCEYRFNSAKNRLYCYTDCNEWHGYDTGKLRAYLVFDFADGDIYLSIRV